MNKDFFPTQLRGDFAMNKKPRVISAQQAHEMMSRDPSVLLVCAYDNDEDFRKNTLEGPISLNEFRKRSDSLPKDENVIFYCACLHDEIATKEAKNYFHKGFANARILDGGVKAWKEAGYSLVEANA
jgi:rhodanese-related sulfurtransferase